MDISIFGYKINLEILILIGVIYLILVGHTVCGCCRFNMMEGNATMADSQQKLTGIDASSNVVGAGNMVAGSAKNGTGKINGKSAGKEGFAGANTNYGMSSPYELGGSDAIDTNSWFKPTLTVEKGKPLSKGVKDILDREPQPVPLPEGEMIFFATTPFKPECCPSSYSTGSGCACATTQQYNYLVQRGGNNVPYSEF